MERQLERIGQDLLRWFPIIVQRLTPELVRQQILKHGEGAWCEKQWIEDCDCYLATHLNR